MIVPKPAVLLDLKVKRGLRTITSASSAPEMTWLGPPEPLVESRPRLLPSIAKNRPCTPDLTRKETPAMKPVALNRKLKKWSAALVRG
jgi:hypothetical protein